MNRNDFEWLRADVSRMASAFRQMERMDTSILSAVGKTACKVYILLEQIAARSVNKEDFRNRIEKEIIQAKRPIFQNTERGMSKEEIYLLEDYLKKNFNPLEDTAELKTRHA